VGFRIEVAALGYSVNDTEIIHSLDFVVEPGSFVAILGENGAGKTTLLDLMMGFRRPTRGSIDIDGEAPHRDPWRQRGRIAYLSEKVDLPGDWTVRDFLRFNEFFYPHYDRAREDALRQTFQVEVERRIGHLSAGQIRRVQAVAALSAGPALVLVDEITAVLDIVGRRRFMRTLSELCRDTGATVIMATNILEDLVSYVSHVLLMHDGKRRDYQTLEAFLGGDEPTKFAQKVADLLEAW
jgi:ABC-2 type transport system ATP-binding protein